MILNRNSIKWLPKLLLVVGVVIGGFLLVIKGQQVQPEFEILNTLEKANLLKLKIISFMG